MSRVEMSSNQTSSTDSVGSSGPSSSTSSMTLMKKNSIPITVKPPTFTKINNINLNLSRELTFDIEPNNEIIKSEHKDNLREELDAALMIAKVQLDDINNTISAMKNWIKHEYEIEDPKEWPLSKKDPLSLFPNSSHPHSNSPTFFSHSDAISSNSSLNSTKINNSTNKSITSTNTGTSTNKPIVRITLGSTSKPHANTPPAPSSISNTSSNVKTTQTNPTFLPSSTSSIPKEQIKDHSKPVSIPPPISSSTFIPSSTSVSIPTPIGRGSKNLSRMMNRPTTLEERPKIPNQTPINIFWAYIESYFKSIEETDLKFLDDPAKVIDPIPFTIPPLGRPYLEQWKELYGYSVDGGSGNGNNISGGIEREKSNKIPFSSSSSSLNRQSAPFPSGKMETLAMEREVKGESEMIMNENIHSLPLNFSLRDRLVAMLIEENENENGINNENENDNMESDQSFMNTNVKVPEIIQEENKNNEKDKNSCMKPSSYCHSQSISSSLIGIDNVNVNVNSSFPYSFENDFVHVDDRIRQELVSLGFEEFADNHNLDENDSICIEMRQLQQLLREQVYLNHYRKKKLADRARSYLPSQEFYSLLQDVNKQIEQAYQRRSKQGKKKKIGRIFKEDPMTMTPSHHPITDGGMGGGDNMGNMGNMTSFGTSPLVASGSGISLIEADCMRLLDTRSRLLEGFQGIIAPLSDTLACVQKSLFNIEEEESVLKNAKDTGSWFNIPSSEDVIMNFTNDNDIMDNGSNTVIDSFIYESKIQPAFPIIK